MARLVVGLTGGLAAGKSTVARRMAAAGWNVVDADQLVGSLYRPGEAGAAAVARLFGPAVLRADGSVDHVQLARRAFRDPEDLARLEAAIHPLVRDRFRRIAEAADGIVVLEAAKLLEAGYRPDFDRVVTVEAPASLRIDRAVARGLERSEVEERMAAQSSEAFRRRLSDHVLVNDGSREALLDATDALVAELEGAARPPA